MRVLNGTLIGFFGHPPHCEDGRTEAKKWQNLLHWAIGSLRAEPVAIWTFTNRIPQNQVVV